VKVLVAMSGGVDSSVAAALLRDAGHDVVGATMKLWGGSSDSGCCSVADVEDARRVAQQVGIDHHVFNFTDDFDAHVVQPYVDAHAAGRTPNPCVECNRHLKFDRFLRRARQLGFDAIATGHHARVVPVAEGWELRRGADGAKDQSYVLSMLGPRELGSVLLPIGAMTKDEVRARATAAGLRTATKPDSQDVCFILGTGGGRLTFLGDRIPLHPGRVVDRSGREVGSVDAVELVTVGQRRGLSSGGDGDRRFALSVDTAARTVVVGSEADLLVDALRLVDETWSWPSGPLLPGAEVAVQSSAHGEPVRATYAGEGPVELHAPQRRVAPGQTVALYVGDVVAGAGIAT
jgi:tRNA-specific 2-thiouridylase